MKILGNIGLADEMQILKHSLLVAM